MTSRGQGRTQDAATAARFSRDRMVMARSLAYLLAAGATLSLAALVVPHEAEVDVHRVLVQAGCGYALAALVVVGGRSLPRWTVQVFLAAATLLIEWNIYASGDSTSPYAAMYFWVAIYAFYFLSRREAVVQTGFIVVAYAALLTQVPDAGNASVLRWAITMSALMVGGALIGALQAQIAALAEAARSDPDTGLLNRRGLSEVLIAELDRARRNGTPASVVVVRFDGHRPLGAGAGGTGVVLGRVAGAVREIKRTMDHAGVIGEREIALLLPECDAHGAYALSERLRSQLKREAGDLGLTFSVCLGVASYPQHGATAEAILHDAAHGVAAAEHLGGDRTVIYNPEIASIVLAAETRESSDRGSNLAAVLALTEVLDIRDAGTAVHSQTVGRYAEVIARGLGFSEELVERVRLAGILHDIGKIAVPDAVLSKPGPLTDEEYAQMKKHPEVGAVIIDGADLHDIASWVVAHHERPDGRGYPLGLSDDEIPLEAKVLAVADAYEAMTVDRVYRRALPVETARAELRRCAGSQFDPRVVEVFLEALMVDDVRLGLDELSYS